MVAPGPEGVGVWADPNAAVDRESPTSARARRAGAIFTRISSNFDCPADLPKMPAQSVIRLAPAPVEVIAEAELGA